MQHRRNDAFLATKSRERSRDGALRDIEQSLKLMKTTISISGCSTTLASPRR